MLERLGIVVAVAVVGIAAYRVGTRLQVSRIARGARNGHGPMEDLLGQLQRGVPGVIYFWSPDCPPCLTIQKPALAALQEELGEEGLQVVAVNVYERPELADEWGVLSLPTTFLVDKTGQPRGVNHGVVQKDRLRRQIEHLA